MTTNWTATWNNVSDVGDLLAVANTTTGGVFWSGILTMIVLVLFMSLLAFGAETALLVSLFIGLMIGTFLLYMGLVSTLVVGVIVGLLFFSILYLMYTSRQQPQ